MFVARSPRGRHARPSQNSHTATKAAAAVSLTGGLVLAGMPTASAVPEAAPPTAATLAAQGLDLAARGIAAPESLAYGARGLAVKFVQLRLGVRPSSGWYGPLTRKAVKRWQRVHGLAATGALTRAQYQRVLTQRVWPPAAKKSERRTERVSRSAPRSARLAGLNWGALAQCESGGNPRAYNPKGYYGLYQFDLRTWRGVGGSGDPRDASRAEQTQRAQILYADRGDSPWPVCGKRLYS